MLIKKIFIFLSNFHYDSIFRYSKNLDFEIMIDVGSHQGEFISRFLKYKKLKRIFCFEPNKILFRRLNNKFKFNKENKSLNGHCLHQCVIFLETFF